MHQDDQDTEIDLEEAYLDTLALPQGFGLRFGRFYSDIGYLNGFHPHAWDFADAPLAYDAFLGGQFGDDGLRLSWLAPTDLYLELALETYCGDRYPGGGNGDWNLGSLQTAALRLGGDLGLSHSWQLGLSGLWAHPEARSGGGHGHGDEEAAELIFDGDSRLGLLDLVWKWAPEGDFSRRYLQLQAEYFYRDEDGDYQPADGGGPAFGYSGDQQGFYLQGVYQFQPRWRAGLRYDRLWSDNLLRPVNDPELAADSGLLSDHDPFRWSAMLDYSHSEFSRLRLQYAYDKRVPERNQVWTLQYIMALGAHGAHQF